MKNGGYKFDSMVECIIAALLFVIDRILKYSIAHSKKTYKLFSFLHYKGIHNTGLALNFLYNNKFVFYLVIITFLLFLAWFVSMLYSQRQFAGVYLVFFGGLSNLIDRFWYGAVIDYIEINGSSIPLPIFNIADILIVVGITMIICSLVKHDKRKIAG